MDSITISPRKTFVMKVSSYELNKTRNIFHVSAVLKFLFHWLHWLIAKGLIVTFFDRITTRPVRFHGIFPYIFVNLTNLFSTITSSVATDIRIDVFFRKYEGFVIFYV